MKRSIRKLALRKETVRTLLNTDLTRVVGGLGADDQLLGETRDKQCALAAEIAAGK
jgi:hypothetical protein